MNLWVKRNRHSLTLWENLTIFLCYILTIPQFFGVVLRTFCCTIEHKYPAGLIVSFVRGASQYYFHYRKLNWFYSIITDWNPNFHKVQWMDFPTVRLCDLSAYWSLNSQLTLKKTRIYDPSVNIQEKLFSSSTSPITSSSQYPLPLQESYQTYNGILLSYLRWTYPVLSFHSL